MKRISRVQVTGLVGAALGAEALYCRWLFDQHTQAHRDNVQTLLVALRKTANAARGAQDRQTRTTKLREMDRLQRQLERQNLYIIKTWIYRMMHPPPRVYTSKC